MKSPFAVFRKHQKVLMVILTGMAMFAFVLLDAPTRTGQLPRSLTVVLVTALAAGAFWVVGTQTGKPTEYALTGALIGAAATFVGFQLGGAEPVVETKAGGLSQQEITRLLRQRQIANQFIQSAYRTVNGPPPTELPESLQNVGNPQLAQQFIRSLQNRWEGNLQRFLFGSATEQNAVLKYLLLQEADKMGITVSDQAVNDYINQATGNGLSRQAFREIYHDRLRLSETALFNILREELRARRAFQLSYPTLLMTPDKYWEYYKRLHVTQQLEVAALPVEHFAADIPDPSDDELAAFFEQYKTVYPGQSAPGEPGFRQPRRVRLAYLEADYQTFESLVPEVTEAEIENYYEKNKEDLYRNRPVAQPTGRNTSPQSPLPGAGSSGTEHGADESQPLEPEFTPESETGPPSDPGSERRKSDSPSESDRPPEEETSTETAPPSDSPGFLSVASSPVVADRPQGTRVVRPVSAPVPVSESPAPAVAPKPLGTTVDDGRLAAVAAPKPLPMYRPLDNQLREEIRDELLRQRTREAMQAKIKEAQNLMYDLGDEYNLAVDPEERTITPQEISDRLQRFAEGNHLRYVVTELLSEQELSNPEEQPIGSATEAVESPVQRRSAPTVAEQVFTSHPQQVYMPSRAEGNFGNSRYAWWKIEDQKSHVPTLDEPGVREQVIEAWKREQARPTAEKRAEELAETARQSDGPLEEALAETTVTPNDDSLQVRVRRTQSFSWLTTSSAPPTGLSPPPQPRLSQPVGVENAGPEFMRTVFERLDVGEIGVVPNGDRSVYYVVRIIGRDPSTSTGWEALRQQFLQEDFFSGPTAGMRANTYDYLIYPEQEELEFKWRDQLEQKYAVRWNRPPDELQAQP